MDENLIATITDATHYGYTATMPELRRANARVRAYLASVGYPTAADNPPEALVEIVCQIAARFAHTTAAAASGVQTQQETRGPFSATTTYSADAWRGQADLTTGEKSALRRLYPELPKTLSMGNPAGGAITS